MKNLVLILAAAIGLSACGESTPPKAIQQQSIFAEFFSQTPDTPSVATFTITNQFGEPISNAQILIGEGLDSPFEGNFLSTDASGNAQVPVEFADLPVTIDAPGYLRATFFNQNSETHTYQLRLADRPATLEMSGLTTGFGSLPKDGMADFGMVMPALTRTDIFAFDMGLVLSPVMDEFEVAGQKAEVPSNITLPKQRESYFIPITLEKEKYRIFFPSPGIKKVYAVRGQFHFKTVIGKMRNGASFADMINDFQFVSSTVRDVEITKNQQLDLPVNENTFGNPIQIKAPQVPNDRVLIALTVAENNGYLLPSDFKRVESNQAINLKTAKLGNQFIVTVQRLASDFYATTPRNGPLSAVMVPLKAGPTPTAIDLFDISQASANQWTARSPAVRGSLNPLATYALLSKVEKIGGQERKVRSWETYALNWQGNMKLPSFPGDIPPTGPLRWEVSYLGNENISVVNFGPGILNSATHVSYNVKDL